MCAAKKHNEMMHSLFLFINSLIAVRYTGMIHIKIASHVENLLPTSSVEMPLTSH